MKNTVPLCFPRPRCRLRDCPSAAQDWPTKPMTMVVPFAPAGGTDLLAGSSPGGCPRCWGSRSWSRMWRRRRHAGFGARWSRRRPTATSSWSAPPPTPSTSRSTRTHSTISPTDLVPAGLMAAQPTVLLARKDFPADNLKEFIAYVKANKDNDAIGSAGVGSTGHLFCELLQCGAGHQRRHPPALSRRRTGDAGSDRRPLRLHLHA